MVFAASAFRLAKTSWAFILFEVPSAAVVALLDLLFFEARLAQTQCCLGAASFCWLSTVSVAAGTECSFPQGLD
jgi:hypothetical protein